MRRHGTEAMRKTGCSCIACSEAHAQAVALRKAGVRAAHVEHPDPLQALFTGRGQFDPTPWVKQAACLSPELDALMKARGQHPTDLFFPSRGQNPAVTEAKAICRSCPVRVQCLHYALRNNEHIGIWGGRSERERRRLRKALNAKARTRQEDVA